MWLDGAVVSDQEIKGQTCCCFTSYNVNNFQQGVHTQVPLSSSSIIWYRSEGDDDCKSGRHTDHVSPWPCVTNVVVYLSTDLENDTSTPSLPKKSLTYGFFTFYL